MIFDDRIAEKTEQVLGPVDKNVNDDHPSGTTLKRCRKCDDWHPAAQQCDTIKTHG